MGAEAALIDDEFTLLPAGERIIELLESRWKSAGTATTSESGRIEIEGFYGDYQIHAEGADGRLLVYRFRHHPASTDPASLPMLTPVEALR